MEDSSIIMQILSVLCTLVSCGTVGVTGTAKIVYMQSQQLKMSSESVS